MWKLIAGVFLLTLGVTNSHAQPAPPPSPAQMGVTPTSNPETLQVLDSTKTWVPLGTVSNHVFTPVTGGVPLPPTGVSKTITNVLAGNTAPSWIASLISGSLDPANVFLGGTEGRQFASKNAGQIIAQLFWGNSYWNDTPGVEGQQNAQIAVLNGPEYQGNEWTVDTSLGATGLPNYQVANGTTSFCPSDNTKCALAVSALQNITFQYDNGGNTGLNVQAMVAASWWEGTSTVVCSGQTPVYVFVRNNTDNLWYQTLLLCDTGTAGQGIPQVRSFGVHLDQVVTSPQHIQNIFAGEAPTGIFAGQLSHTRSAALNILAWNTLPEWKSSNYAGPACTAQTRIMGFAELVGSDSVLREYMSACFSIYYRLDGPQAACASDQVYISSVCVQRWKLYWEDPNPGTSMSGLRGLTATPDGVLLIGTEGSSPQNYYAIKPVGSPNGCSTPTSTNCWVSEYTVTANTAAATNMTIGNTVAPYNNFPTVYDEQGNPHLLAAQSNYITNATTSIPTGSPLTFLYINIGSTGKKIAEGTYTYRNSPSTYDFVSIPELFPNAMNGIRDMIASPFISDCGHHGGNILTCAVYATGFDDDGATLMYWCKVNPCVPPSPLVQPIHNTAWIAKLQYPFPY